MKVYLWGGVQTELYMPCVSKIVDIYHAMKVNSTDVETSAYELWVVKFMSVTLLK